MDILTEPATWLSLITLTAMEIVLGIDNVIFISILAGKLPHAQQARARTVGLALAMLTRILLLLSLAWIIRLTNPLSHVGQKLAAGGPITIVAIGSSSTAGSRA